MGNTNLTCSPNDCMSTMRPGQFASDCFRSGKSREKSFKVNGGTPLELLEEWNEVTKNVVAALTEDPESNLYVLRLSKALLNQLFSKDGKPVKERTQQPTEK